MGGKKRGEEDKTKGRKEMDFKTKERKERMLIMQNFGEKYQIHTFSKNWAPV